MIDMIWYDGYDMIWLIWYDIVDGNAIFNRQYDPNYWNFLNSSVLVDFIDLLDFENAVYHTNINVQMDQQSEVE